MILNKIFSNKIVLNNRNNAFFVLPRFYAVKNGLDLWAEDINTNIKLDIEKHWGDDVLKTYKNSNDAETYYVLSMFPYPSGNLHMGHVRVYSISDTVARFQKMCGKNVIHPMGWDAFGLPAENAALLNKIPPYQWTKENIDVMKKQLFQLGFNFDWHRELSTCDPKYYKWTQYIFLKLLENGLAYQNKALVNWDPVDQTVLADEQVDDLGCSWRSGAKVEKKYLTQWFIRTTKFAKQLYDGLNDEALDNWKDIINLQQHWIGACNGVVVTFNLVSKIANVSLNLDVWTSEPYKFLYCDFLTISSENVIAKEYSNYTENNKLPISAYNPVANKNLPIYVSDSVEYPEGRDVYIACSHTCDSDLALSLNHKSASNNMINENDSQIAIDIATSKHVGGYYVSSKLKDWLISRQRYWGTPIPIIHCDNCGTVPVPYSDLPVKLPENVILENGKINTLKDYDDWVNCECPKCQKPAKRETDTMDTFVDSSWYYYRYLDPYNEVMPFEKQKLECVAPVDVYIGGKEHAVLHLYYTRFMSYFFHHLGWTPTAEPFKKLLVQGMVMGKSYKVKSTGKYIPESEVNISGKTYTEKATGEQVIFDWEKMSKSKFNGENPERLLTTYGCDTTRLFILADVPPATTRQWSDATFPGVLNWQHRLWLTIRDLLSHRSDNELYNKQTVDENEYKTIESKIWDSRNYFTATTTYHFKYTQHVSVGISRLQGLTNILRNKLPPEVIARSREYELALGSLIIMLAPVAPHFCSELWSGFLSAPNRVNTTTPLIDWQSNVLDQKWPRVEDHYKLSFLCKVDGADRCDLKINASELNNYTHAKALSTMLKENNVTKFTKKGILKSKFDLFPGSRGILYIFTNRNVKKEKVKINE